MDETPRIIALEIEEDALVLEWSHGGRNTLPYIWLRDNSPDAFHANGQRVLDTFSLPENPIPLDARSSAEGDLEIRWTEERSAVYSRDFLRNHIHGTTRPEAGLHLWKAPRLWKKESWSGPLPRETFADIMKQGDALRRWLRAVRDFGFALLDDVPLEEDSPEKVIRLFGFARETNYGNYWDVRSVAEPNNLAFTGLALGVHTDNPYRDPVPTLQLLMCMESDLEGGESILVDGFAAARALRESRPDYFRVLNETPVRFRFRDAGVDLEDEKCIIDLDARGEVRAVHFNNRSIQPFSPVSGETRELYAAYRAFAGLLNREGFELRFRLAPGSLFLLDNRRVLHGRTALSGEGRRRLRGCYADRDGLYSRLAVLESEMPAAAAI